MWHLKSILGKDAWIWWWFFMLGMHRQQLVSLTLYLGEINSLAEMLRVSCCWCTFWVSLCLGSAIEWGISRIDCHFFLTWDVFSCGGCMKKRCLHQRYAGMMWDSSSRMLPGSSFGSLGLLMIWILSMPVTMGILLRTRTPLGEDWVRYIWAAGKLFCSS